MAFFATSRIRTEDPVVGATVWVVAEVPDGPYVSVFRLAAGDRAVLSANSRDGAEFCVPAGRGWVHGSGVDRSAVRAGGHIFIYRGDAVTLEAESGLDVVVVSADWVIPEGAGTPSASFRQLTPRVYAHPRSAQITVGPVAEVPDGTSVKVLTFPVGAVLDLPEASWNAVYYVLSGSGWAAGSGLERTDVAAGDRVFRLSGNSLAIGATTEMRLLSVGADWVTEEAV